MERTQICSTLRQTTFDFPIFELKFVVMEKPGVQHAEHLENQTYSRPDSKEAGGIVSEVPTASGLRIREDGHVSDRTRARFWSSTIWLKSKFADMYGYISDNSCASAK